MELKDALLGRYGVLLVSFLLLCPAAAAQGLIPVDVCANGNVRKIEHVSGLMQWGTRDQSDWTRAYQLLSQTPEIKAIRCPEWYDAHEFFGLTKDELRCRYGSQKSRSGWVNKDASAFSYGNWNGTTFEFKYGADGRVNQVRESSSGCQSNHIGPWLINREQALLRSELDYTWLIEPNTVEDRPLIKKRALIRHQLHQDEFAARDLDSLLFDLKYEARSKCPPKSRASKKKR